MSEYSDKIDQQKEHNLSMVERALDEATAPAPDLYVPWVPVDISDFDTATIPPHRFVVDPIFPRLEVTLLAGNGKAGKSMLLLAVAACVAAGQPWGPFHVTAGRVLWISLEDKGGDIKRRLARITKAYALDAASVKANLQIVDAHAGVTELAAEAFDDPTRTRVLLPTARLDDLREAAKGYDLTIVDSGSEAFGGNENDRREVRRFIQLLVGIAEAEDAALVLSAHVNKPAGREGEGDMYFSGSSAWHNAVRSRLALVSSKGSIRLEHQAATHTAPAEPVALSRLDGGVLWPLTSEGAAAAARAAGAADDDAVLQAVSAALGRGIEVRAAQSGPATTWHAIANLPELPPQLQDAKEGKRRTLRAAARLESAGKVVRVEVKDGSRNKYQCLALTQSASVAGQKTCVSESPIPPALTHARGSRGASVPDGASVQHSRSTHALTQPEGGKV